MARIQPLLTRQEIRFLSPIRAPKAPAERGHIYELRMYRTQIGKVRAWADLFMGVMPTREKYSQNCGILMGKSPEPHSVAHIWAYKDLNDRMRARGPPSRCSES